MDRLSVLMGLTRHSDIYEKITRINESFFDGFMNPWEWVINQYGNCGIMPFVAMDYCSYRQFIPLPVINLVMPILRN